MTWTLKKQVNHTILCLLPIGSMMDHSNSAPVTHHTLACMMPTLASQPGPASSSFVMNWSYDTLPPVLTAVLTCWEERNDHAVIMLSSLTFQTWPQDESWVDLSMTFLSQSTSLFRL